MAIVMGMELEKENFFPNLFANESLRIKRLGAASFRFARFLTANVEDDIDPDRSAWKDAKWQQYLSDPHCEFYAVFCDDEPAGCAEIFREPRLMRSRGGSIRIRCFGFLPEFQHEGMGAALLTRLLEKCFSTGAARVTVRSASELPPEMISLCRYHGFTVLKRGPLGLRHVHDIK